MAVQIDKFAGHQVRLLPSMHIKSEREAELRATSSLLAVILAVSEFGRLLVHRAGGPGGRLSCFTEPPFQLRVGEGIKPEPIRPDGLVRSVHGKEPEMDERIEKAVASESFSVDGPAVASSESAEASCSFDD